MTDNRGGTSSLTRDVTVTPANALPTAAFMASCPQAGLTCTFTDGSTDPDGNGTIASWTWEFGDQATVTATAPDNQSHDYPNPNDYVRS